MEEKKSSEIGNKVGNFVSTAVTRIINLVMILVIIALVALVAWFWHENEVLKNDIKNLNEKIEDFEKMSSMDESQDVVVEEKIKEESKTTTNVTTESEVANNTNDVVDSSNINKKVYFEIKELGVKFLVDEDFAKNLTYTIVNQNTVNFSTKELNSIKGNNCDTDLVRISKINGVANNNDPYAMPINMNEIKQFSNYYVMVSNPQVSCTNGQSIELEHEVLNEVNKEINSSLTEI